MQEAQWAETEFGGAQLGDVRRTRRLVAMAAEVASRPAGRVTEACASSASQEGAFRWLETHAVRVEPVVEAAVGATLRRCVGQPCVYVAVDSTSLTLRDGTQKKGLGAVGSWSDGARGIHAMTAFAVGKDDCPIGICGQRLWVREQRSKLTKPARSGDVQHRETRFWLEQLGAVQEAFAEQAGHCVPWFQLDRGADCWPVIAMASEQRLLLTVRAAHDRRVDHRLRSLWSTLEHTPVRAFVRIDVPARPPRRKRQRKHGRLVFSRTPPQRARRAKVAIRAATVSLQLTTGTGKRFTVPFNAVLVRESRRRPDDRLEWMLLTTHPVRTAAEALAVVRGYKARWRIEELHRTWKRGLCRVEDTQLRSRQAIFKWATLLAVVAARAMRLTYLAREQPELPADQEFSPTELEALIVLRKPKGIRLGFVPTLGQAVRWVADLGGYTGPWNGPPGPTVIGRGLHDVLAAARAFENRDKMR